MKMANNGTGGSRSYLSSFVIGSLVGAAAALLMAPQSGQETRRQIRARGIEVRAMTEHNIDETISRLRSAVNDLNSRADELRLESRVALEVGQKQLTAVADETRKVTEEAIREIRRAATQAIEETRKAAIEAAHTEPA
jgi:gas vesicle protein